MEENGKLNPFKRVVNRIEFQIDN